MRIRRWTWLASTLLLAPGLTSCADSSEGGSPDPESHADTDAPGPTSEGSGSTGSDEGETAAVADGPTWHADIAPIISESCSGCHATGGIGPFPFVDYASTAPLAPVIAASVESRSMPPWGAAITESCTPPHAFKSDISLSDDEIALIRAWADAGAPEGDPAFAAEVPPPPNTELEQVDQVLTIEGTATVDGIQDQFLCFSVDPGLTEDRYFSGLQIVPGNAKIVHHVLVYVDETGATADQAGPGGFFPCSGGTIGGELLGAWAPGAIPLRTPADLGMRVPAGARLVLNIHYHPTGQGPESDDSTSLQLDWMDEVPTWRGMLALIGNSDSPDTLMPGPGDDSGVPQFRIPAGASGHVEEMVFEVPEEIPFLRIWSVAAHMHYVGKQLSLHLDSATGISGEQCLLDAPYYSFEWQRLYSYEGELDQMPAVQAGDTIRVRCTYDNSMNNPHVVDALSEQGLDAPVDVYLGEETLDEMCLGAFGVALPTAL